MSSLTEKDRRRLEVEAEAPHDYHLRQEILALLVRAAPEVLGHRPVQVREPTRRAA